MFLFVSAAEFTRRDERGLFKQCQLPCPQHGGRAAGADGGPRDPEACFHSGVSPDGGPGHVLLRMLGGYSEAVVTLQKTLGHCGGADLPVWAHASDCVSASP